MIKRLAIVLSVLSLVACTEPKPLDTSKFSDALRAVCHFKVLYWRIEVDGTAHIICQDGRAFDIKAEQLTLVSYPRSKKACND